MRHNTPDFRRRAQLSELMDEPCSRAELQACLRDLAQVNRLLLAYRPILSWLDSLALDSLSEPVRILDVGCGYGDTLRRVDTWARQRGIAVELTGIDLNPHTAVIASEVTPSQSRIQWLTADVFAYAPPQRPHLVISSLFTHHLEDADVVRFLCWMEDNALAGWLINDLSRASNPYHAFRWLAKLMRWHPFVQHDGPVSVARAFIEQDWRNYCARAGLAEPEIAIRGFKPGRLCVSRRKNS